MEPTGPKKNPAEEPQFRASDVRDTAGLTYRQLNDWEAKGALPSQSDREAGWRKFSPREVFAIMVCAEIRERFGVPVESLRFIRSFMLQDGADHLQAAVDKMGLGLTVWLLTDCKETFVMDSDIEFEDLFNLGFFRGDDARGYVFLKLNPIVNRLLTAHKPPIHLKTRPSTYDAIRKAQSVGRAMDMKEIEVLALIRDGAFKRVTVELDGGSIVSASTEQEHVCSGGKVANEEILRIIESKQFQTVTLKSHDGKTVRIHQTVRIPIKAASSTPPAKRVSSTPRRNPDRRSGKRTSN
jgi:hypothetical protein